ncbi:MAG: spore cortex biosynthesis protein YabQ, partial [Bacillota bacterium]
VLLPALTATDRSVGGGVSRRGRGTRRAAGALARAVRRGMAGLRTLVGWLLMPVTRPLRWLLAPLLAPVHRALIAPVAARLRRFVLDPWRRGVPSRRRIAAAWRRWRAAMAAWLGPGKGEPPPPRS